MGCSSCNKHHLILEQSNEEKFEKIKKENHSSNVIEEKIIENDLNELAKIYPQEKDGIKVEKRGPIENEKDNTFYCGEWDINKNIQHGRGIKFWLDGTIFIGYWRNGKACGKGIIYHFDGDIYEGDWLNDKPNGYGVYTHKDGTRYEGEWKNDKQNGNGKEIWADGSFYEGEFSDGKKNGKGKFIWAAGSIYEGNLTNN